MNKKLTKKEGEKFDSAQFTARLAYLESSLNQFVELKTASGDDITVNGEKVFKYRERMEDYNLYLIELPREIKREMIEEYAGIGSSGIIKSIQEEFKKPEQINALAELLKVQKEESNNSRIRDFVIVGPSLETSFKILMMVIKK